MTAPVLVTGASGNVGRAVVAGLQARGVPVRAAGTNPESLARLHPGADTVRLDLHDPTTFGPALDGARGLFLVRPPAVASVGPTLNALLDVAERSGIAHAVFCSVAGADTNRVVPHHRVEEHLRASSLPWTILRPGFFAQNLADAYATDIVRDRRIYLPAGKGRAAFIDARDIGEAAAIVLADPAAHRSAEYLLTGPESLSFDAVAQILAAELGHPVDYRQATALGYLRHVHRQGRPWMQALVQTLLHVGLRRGQADVVDPTLHRLLGRAPRTLEQYVHDHRAAWVRSEGEP